MLGARAAANNDWRQRKWEVDGHGGGICYGVEVRWGSELGFQFLCVIVLFLCKSC
jgi:hypothetical protein